MKLDDPILIKRIIEAAIMAADKPLAKRAIVELFDELEKPDDELINQALETLAEDCEKRGYELVRVASGYRYQVKQELSPWVSKLWKEKAPRYSRALLETLSLVAYRQPITRGEIEDIRGVAVSTQIIKTLLERDWVKIVGHKDVPGRPAIYATTKKFLDYFNLKNLDQLPPLAEIRDISAISEEFNIEIPPELQEAGEAAEQELAEAADGEVADSVQEAGSADAPGQGDDTVDQEDALLEESTENAVTGQESHGDLESFGESDDINHSDDVQNVEMHASDTQSGDSPLNC